MKKIVGIIRPFDVSQKFYVYEDGNKIDAIDVSINAMNKALFELIDKYDVHQIDLSGPKQYIKGLSNSFKEEELLKYNVNSTEINII